MAAFDSSTGGFNWPLAGGPCVEGFMSLVSVRGNLIVYPLGLMWMPWLNGDAKVLAGRALRYGGFGLGVRGLLELYGGFGRARWRP